MLPLNLIQDIINVLSKNHSIFIAREMGIEFLGIMDITLLKNFGVKYKGLYDVKNDTIHNNYRLGQLTPYLERDELEKLNYKDLQEYVKSKNTIKLTPRDLSIINGCKQQVQTSIRALQSRMTNEINQVVINKFQEIYQNTNVDSIEKVSLDKNTIKEITTEISSKIKKWEYEFNRILEYNSTDSFEKGKSEQILKDSGRESLVYKLVDDDACKYCKKMFRSHSLQPKIYKLETLINNGSNIGRKSNQWKPTIGPIHVNCRCQLKKVPEGYKYNPKTGKFDLKDQTYNPNKRGKRDKIDFKFKGKDYSF